MSILIVKAGIADTIQDAGRYGYQHLGINPNGAMDQLALNISNIVVGNHPNEAVIEYGFPAPSITFKGAALLALSGADFGATLNGKDIPINTPIYAPASSVLRFTKNKEGVYGYLAVAGGFALPDWLASWSTHLKAGAGGFFGRRLQKEDEIPFNNKIAEQHTIIIYPWYCDITALYESMPYIRCLKGQEFEWMQDSAKKLLQEKAFTVTSQSDRMGYRLLGKRLEQKIRQELISTAVIFGTIQLLPDGQLVVLMADHQTTGGYPRIAQVISADLPKLAQSKIHSQIYIEIVSLQTAEELRKRQQRHLHKVQVACRLQLEKNASSIINSNSHVH
jgi:antagonist of KipI